MLVVDIYMIDSKRCIPSYKSEACDVPYLTEMENQLLLIM